MLMCRDVSELVTDYLEQSMPLRRRFAVRWHLQWCGACRRYVDQMRKTVRLLAAVQPAPPQAGLEDRLVAAARPAPGAD